MENNQTQPVVNQAPEASQPQVPQSIPYDRFSQVVAERNALREQIGQFVQAPPAQPSHVGINTVEELMAAVDRTVEGKLNNAYQSRLAPLENNIKDYRFQNTVEGYFASDPAKAQLRADMDAYTAALTPQEQQFLKDSVANGRTQWLDNIFHSVLSQKQNSLVGQANQQAQQTAGIAQSPTQYRTLGQVEPSMNDKIQNAKKTGDFSDVFRSMIPKK